MFKACSKCGKIHDSNYICNKGKIYRGGNERKLRNTYKWAKKSREIRESAHNLCEVCLDKGVYTYNGLEVHHIIKLKENEDGLLDNNNLICLCTQHHKQADRGEIDIDYLRRLVELREQPPAFNDEA